MWKPVKHYENLYEVSSFGEIKSLKRNKLLTKSLDKYGYFKVGLSKNGKTVTHTVHRLVAITFLQNFENKPTVNHINGIKTDNNINNLEWNTVSEQTKHAHKLKLINQEGEKNPSASLTNKDAQLVRKLKMQGFGCTKIAKITGFNYHTLKHVYYNKTFKNIQDESKNQEIVA